MKHELTIEDAAIVHAAGLRSTRTRAVEVIRMMDGDRSDYQAMRSCVEAMKCSLPRSRVEIETNQNARPHDVAEYLLTCGKGHS